MEAPDRIGEIITMLKEMSADMKLLQSQLAKTIGEQNYVQGFDQTDFDDDTDFMRDASARTKADTCTD
jgi:hypothetical protein